jgi:glycosyltransferase involved in cell wall biosynthesis
MMKRIVLITTSFPRTVAGSESAGSFVEDFSAMLGKRCQLVVVAPGFADAQETGDGYTIFRYRAPERALSQLKLWSPPDVLKIVDVMRHGAAVTAQAVAELKPDFVFALWALPSGYWAAQAVRGTSIPYGTWCLGSDIWSMGKIPVIRSLLSSVLRRAHLVCADGYVLADDVTALAGVDCHFLPSSRQLPLPPPVAPRAAAPYRLLFIGRWHPNKGADLLVDALTMLDAADWALIRDVRIYGGGPQEADVRAKGAALQAAGRPVQVFGYIDKAGAAQVLHECDWLLIPSRIESIPVVFSDAMQSQRPVVSMPVGDLPRLVTEFGVGVLAGEVSAASFAAAVRAALQKPAAHYAEGLTAAARTFAVDGSVQELLRKLDA